MERSLLLDILASLVILEDLVILELAGSLDTPALADTLVSQVLVDTPEFLGSQVSQDLAALAFQAILALEHPDSLDILDNQASLVSVAILV